MAYCTNCGKELGDNAKFCPECGAEQTAVMNPEVEELCKKTNEEVEDNFGKALAATICASFPVASIVAIVLGNKALCGWKKATALAAEHGFKLTGKNIAVRVLGLIGKIGGIFMTVFWALYLLIIIGIVAAGVAGAF